MLEQQPPQAQADPSSRLHPLLLLLRTATEHDPPPSLRARLRRLSARQLRPRRISRSIPALAGTLLLLVASFLLVRRIHRGA